MRILLWNEGTEKKFNAASDKDKKTELKNMKNRTFSLAGEALSNPGPITAEYPTYDACKNQFINKIMAEWWCYRRNQTRVYSLHE